MEKMTEYKNTLVAEIVSKEKELIALKDEIILLNKQKEELPIRKLAILQFYK